MAGGSRERGPADADGRDHLSERGWAGKKGDGADVRFMPSPATKVASIGAKENDLRYSVQNTGSIVRVSQVGTFQV